MAEAFYGNVKANIQLLEEALMKEFTKSFPAPAPAPSPFPEPYPANLVFFSNIATMSDLEQLALAIFSRTSATPSEADVAALAQELMAYVSS